MSNNSTIDKLFQDQLNDLPLSGKEALWEQMEKKLDAATQPKKSKRRFLLLLLCVLPVASYFLLRNFGTSTQKTQQSTETKSIAGETNTAGSDKLIKEEGNNPADVHEDRGQENIQSNKILDVQEEQGIANKNHQLTFISSGKSKVSISSSNVVEMVEDESMDQQSSTATIDQNLQLQNEATWLVNKLSVERKSTLNLPALQATNFSRTKKEKPGKRVSVGVAAGMDLFLKAKEKGGFAGLQVRVPLNKKISILTGALVAKHKMEENYSNAEKQRLNPDRKIDAKLEGLTVLQVPLLYEQSLPGTKVNFRAGVTPTYIIAAGIYNVPNSFNGNAANYKKFTIDDLHRLNVLFTASVGVGITRRLEVELKANYGLTELVKNSYINQSSVNNNFKSAQVGIVYKIKKN